MSRARGRLLALFCRRTIRIIYAASIILIAFLNLDVPKMDTNNSVTMTSKSDGGYSFLGVGETADRVFYNRVPKCGSHTMLDLLTAMATRNNFTLTRSQTYMDFTMHDDEQSDFAQMVNSQPVPVVYERHLHFVDFRSFGLGQPLYINLIRDPLERMVSWYYFRRYQDGHKRKLPTDNLIRTFDECVLWNETECVEALGHRAEEGYFKIIPFFCGQQPHCRVPGEESLRQAIQNVKSHYVVVGIMEELSDFITALEYLLPNYFRGASNYFNEKNTELWRKHQTTYKLPPSAEVTNIMRDKLKYEYEFYHFIQQHFHRLIQDIKQKIKR